MNTPGPWSILDTSIIAKEESIVVANMSVGLQMHANATLIAAAPDLLRVAKKLERFHTLGPNIKNQLRAVIAKAEGGTP